RRVAHVRADRRRPVRGPERAGDVARPTGIRLLGGVGGLPGEPRGGDVELANDVRSEAVVGLGDACRRERVRAEDVRAGVEVALVDRGDGARLRQTQQVAVATEFAPVVAEPVAPILRLAEAVRLE